MKGKEITMNPVLSQAEDLSMAIPKLKPRYTVDEYLAMERQAEERHIYLDGEIFAMAGDSYAHGDITVNVVVDLGNQLQDSPCRVRTKDTKVRSGPEPMPGSSTSGFFSYPDVLVICGEAALHDSHRDIILNPKLIAEVLSPSMEGFDRGEKFTRFQKWNPSLTDYLWISQDRPRIEHHQRQASGEWSHECYDGLSDRAIAFDWRFSAPGGCVSSRLIWQAAIEKAANACPGTERRNLRKTSPPRSRG
jgi:Uma2 family endonuclease